MTTTPAIGQNDPSPHGALGATSTTNATSFGVWAPSATRAAVRLFLDETHVLRTLDLKRGSRGYFYGSFADVKEGDLYKFVLDGERELPDPYARFLPFGVHGPARVESVTQPRAGSSLKPPPLERSVIYELHIGTFTPEGTWRAAAEKLEHLVKLGVTTVEVMPIAAFAGKRGWGYDGVAPLAPHAAYGTPADVRAFLHAAHAKGLAVLLDVVLNHFGPDGNYFPAYARSYFTSANKTAWGDAPDFANPRLRALCLQIARTWLVDYGFDGLRLDATHTIVDHSTPHILAELADFVRTLEPKKILIAEDERNDPELITRHGLDAVWADDFHHVVHTILTGERDGYYAAYDPTASELARVIERGWLYEGQIFPPNGMKRGRPAEGLRAANLVYCIQNHDQIGNRAFGTRIHHDVDLHAHAAAAMLLLFLPTVPMLFMGEEWGTTSPFLYFTDHEPELGKKITHGRRAEFAHFRQFGDASVQSTIPDPQSAESFRSSKLDWAERLIDGHAELLDIYRHMLRLRAHDDVLKSTDAPPTCEVDGSVLVVRRENTTGARTLLFNTSREPAKARVSLTENEVMLSSGGAAEGAELTGHAAVLLRSRA